MYRALGILLEFVQAQYSFWENVRKQFPTMLCIHLLFASPILLIFIVVSGVCLYKQDIQEVYVDHTNSIKGQGCAFVVKTAQRTFYLSAATGQAVRVWVDVIFTGAEGYREYRKDSTVDGGR